MVSQVLQLQLIGGTDKALGITGGHNRVGQLPNLARGILKGAVAVNHRLDMVSGGFAHQLANFFGYQHSITGEQLHTIFIRLIGTQQTILGIVAAARHRSGH